MASDILHDFGANKTEKLKRSTWITPMRMRTAFPQGVLIPLGFYNVIPNSTISDDVSFLNRLALTPLKPFMSDVFFTYAAYFVPYRVLFENYKEMFGNGKPSEWSDPQEYVMATGRFFYDSDEYVLGSAGAGYDSVYSTCVDTSVIGGGIISKEGNLANYLGLPKTTDFGDNFNEYFNIAPFLAYERIWSDYWRDENYQNPDPDLEKAYHFTSGETNIQNMRFCLHYANRFHDYLTSLLPDTQKGEPVKAIMPIVGLNASGGEPILHDMGKIAFSSNANNIAKNMYLVTTGTGALGGEAGAAADATYNYTNMNGALNITEFRNAWALQRAKERNARTGSRSMNEAMHGIFEANAPAILDKAEFLGGNTIKLNITSVPQTNDTPGKLGAYSATGSNTASFVKTFDEPGLVMYVGCVRIKHAYQFSVEPYWTKKRRYDFFDPALAHISEVPAYGREKFGLTGDYDTVIGFRPAWVEYEKPIDKISGYLANTGSNLDLSKWVLQEDYNQSDNIDPTGYYPEDKMEIAKACIDYNENFDSYQFIIDFNAALKVTAPKPLYAIPGFIDHIIA